MLAWPIRDGSGYMARWYCLHSYWWLFQQGAGWVSINGLHHGYKQQDRIITISRALLSGLALGFVWWLVFDLLLANIMSHHAFFSLDFGRFLSTFPIDLLFGVVLGAIYYQLQQQRAAAAFQA